MSTEDESGTPEVPQPLDTKGKLFLVTWKNPKASGFLSNVYTSRGFAISAFKKHEEKDGARFFEIHTVLRVKDIEDVKMGGDSILMAD